MSGASCAQRRIPMDARYRLDAPQWVLKSASDAPQWALAFCAVAFRCDGTLKDPVPEPSNEGQTVAAPIGAISCWRGSSISNEIPLLLVSEIPTDTVRLAVTGST